MQGLHIMDSTFIMFLCMLAVNCLSKTTIDQHNCLSSKSSLCEKLSHGKSNGVPFSPCESGIISWGYCRTRGALVHGMSSLVMGVDKVLSIDLILLAMMANAIVITDRTTNDNI